jgi:ABC-2 type transport system permease protein
MTLSQYNFVGIRTLLVKEIYRFLGIPSQTIAPPLLSALLYILIFGQFIGSRIENILPGVSYIDFMVPGLLMMNVVNGAFMGTSFGLYLYRFQNSIQEILVAPLSYLEMGFGFMLAGALRGIVTGLGVYVLAIFFTSATIAHFGQFLFFLVISSILFSALGAIVGMWAQNFEQINLPQTFLLLPLSFLGGVFHSASLLPEPYSTLTRLNPIFYMVNGIRGGMIGVSDTSPWLAGVIVGVMGLAAFIWCVRLFQTGWRLRT